MSYTSMFEIDHDGNCQETKDYSNSWGAAPFVWRSLARKYLNTDWWIEMASAGDRLWRLDRNERLPSAERIVLVLTFDRVVVPRDAMYPAAAAIDEFIKAYPPVSGEANHWPQIADDLRDAHARGVRAVCWEQTSVASRIWRIYDQATEQSRPYNIDTGTEHFLLFDKYPELKPTDDAAPVTS